MATLIGQPVLWHLVTRADRRQPIETIFANRETAERERQSLRAAYGASATTRLTPIRVLRPVEVQR
jgi:hypothetical protein